MDDSVRDRLCELIAEHGRPVCSTPGSLRMLLRQTCPNGGEAIDDIVRSLDVPAVRALLANPVEVADRPATVAALTATGYSSERADWVASSWLDALGSERFDRPGGSADWSAWNRLDVSAETAGGTGSHQRSIWHLAIVALAGLAGGAGVAVSLWRLGEEGLIEPWREAFDGMTFAAGVASVAVLGALGGAAGGIAGWALGGGRSWTYDAWGGTSLGRLGLAALGAFNMASVGVLASLGFFGLYGVLPLALLGAAFGSFIGLLVAERISRFL